MVQDCLLSFISALQNGSIAVKGTIEHYLRQSVRNRCIDQLRKRSGIFSLDDLEMLPQRRVRDRLRPVAGGQAGLRRNSAGNTGTVAHAAHGDGLRGFPIGISPLS